MADVGLMVVKTAYIFTFSAISGGEKPANIAYISAFRTAKRKDGP